jgi:uncharacterized protein
MEVTQLNYSKKTALVTGASSGIGEVFANELAKKGCNLILVARSEDKLKQIANKLQETHSINVIPLSVDLSSVNAAEKIAQKSQFGKNNVDPSMDLIDCTYAAFNDGISVCH